MDAQNIEALREIEVPYLEKTLAESVANLAYPVGCGVAPHPGATRRAAESLFERFVAIATALRTAQNEEQREVDWSVAEWLIEQPRVDEALRNFADDQTANNAAGLVQAILETAPSVPEGWRLVPVEPTRGMLDWVAPGFGTPKEAYRQLLAAAPQPAPKALRDMTEADFDEAHGFQHAPKADQSGDATEMVPRAEQQEPMRYSVVYRGEDGAMVSVEVLSGYADNYETVLTIATPDLAAENARLRAELESSYETAETTARRQLARIEELMAQLAAAQKDAELRMKIAEDALTLIANEGIGQSRDDATDALRELAAIEKEKAE